MTRNGNNVGKNIDLVNSISNDELRNILLAKTLTAIDEMEHKVIGNGRLVKPENEKIRQGYLKGIINGCNVACRILKDKQLSDLEDEIVMLKKGLHEQPVVSDEAVKEVGKLSEKIESIKEKS